MSLLHKITHAEIRLSSDRGAEEESVLTIQGLNMLTVGYRHLALRAVVLACTLGIFMLGPYLALA